MISKFLSFVHNALMAQPVESELHQLVLSGNTLMHNLQQYDQSRVNFRNTYAKWYRCPMAEWTKQFQVLTRDNPRRWSDLFEDMLSVHLQHDKIISNKQNALSEFSFTTYSCMGQVKDVSEEGLKKLSSCVQIFMDEVITNPTLHDALLIHPGLFSFVCMFGRDDQVKSFLQSHPDNHALSIRALSTCAKTHCFLMEHQLHSNFRMLLQFCIEDQPLSIADVYQQAINDKKMLFTEIFHLEADLTFNERKGFNVFSNHSTKAYNTFYLGDGVEIKQYFNLHKDMQGWSDEIIWPLLEKHPGFGLSMMHYGSCQSFDDMSNKSIHIIYSKVPAQIDSALFYALRINVNVDTLPLSESARDVLNIFLLNRDMLGYESKHHFDDLQQQDLQYQQYIAQVYRGESTKPSIEEIALSL